MEYFLIIGICLFFGFFLGFVLEKYSKTLPPKAKTKYIDALHTFNEWKKDIGGVALKGVGQHYERWLLSKVNDEIHQARRYAHDNTNKELRKDHE